MRRPLPLLLTAALGLAALGSPALAAPGGPAPQADPRAADAVPDQLLVGYVAGATEGDKARARGRAAAAREDVVVAAAADRTAVELVRLPQGRDRDRAEAELEADPAVAYAEPNWVLRTQAVATDPYFADGRLWGMRGGFGSNAEAAWAAGRTGSAGVYVGVIDEGIQFSHPDLAGQVGNPGETANGRDDDGNGLVDDVYGFDFANNDNTVYDGGKSGNGDDHGTHVAGTIGAKANNGVGVVGVNWDVRMISGKFLGRSGGSLANAVRAVDYFTDLKKRGVNIVATNNSWGGGGFSSTLLAAIQRADAAGILFIAAAGNSGTNNDTTASYPSGYDVPNVIAVAAIDRNGGLASFSQFGAQTVDLGAPGVDVWSTTALNGYSSYSGTSMATPHVAGAAALYKATTPAATAGQIKNALLSSAVPTASLAGRTVTGGRLDANAALSR